MEPTSPSTSTPTLVCISQIARFAPEKGATFNQKAVHVFAGLFNNGQVGIYDIKGKLLQQFHAANTPYQLVSKLGLQCLSFTMSDGTWLLSPDEGYSTSVAGTLPVANLGPIINTVVANQSISKFAKQLDAYKQTAVATGSLPDFTGDKLPPEIKKVQKRYRKNNRFITVMSCFFIFLSFMIVWSVFTTKPRALSFLWTALFIFLFGVSGLVVRFKLANK